MSASRHKVWSGLLLPHEAISLSLYRFIEEAGKGEWRGTFIGDLVQMVKTGQPQADQLLVVEEIKRLHAEQSIGLRKWIDGLQDFRPYIDDIGADQKFFYQGEFQLKVLPSGRPWFQLLEQRVAEGITPAAKSKELRRAKSKQSKGSELTLIADSRLVELRTLVSPQFDFKNLIRFCEELNMVYHQKCYFATAMLTRGLLDHVPPLFGKATFAEVANHYGSRSFKDTMNHLENAARKVADGHLHGHIRKSETLPAAQQVNFAAPIDVLLAEIVRITQST